MQCSSAQIMTRCLNVWKGSVLIQVTLDVTNTYNGYENSLYRELPYDGFRDTVNPQPSAQKIVIQGDCRYNEY